MEKTKLIALLRTFSPEEMKGLTKFVHSPLYNKHEQLQRFTGLLAKAHPDFSSTKVRKQHIYQSLYPGAPYRDGRMRELIAYELRLVENYLVKRQLEKDPYVRQQLLLEGLREKGESKHFEQKVQQIRKKWSGNIFRDEQYYYNRYLLENEVDEYDMYHGRRSRNDNLQPKVDNLDVFYLSAKLKASCEMINRENIVSRQYEYTLLDELMRYIGDQYERFKDIPAIVLYYQVLLTLREPQQEAHYNTLKVLLDRHNQQFQPEEAHALYAYALNYCVKKINAGNDVYLEEIFRLYKALLENGILMYDGHLPEYYYKNIVSAGCRLKQYDWTYQFIQQYKAGLLEEVRANAHTYNLAAFYFETKAYDKAIELLLGVEFTDIFYDLGAKTMLLKIYFEEEEDEPLFSLIEAFRIYLKRNKKVSDNQRKAYANMIKLANKIYRQKLKQGLTARLSPAKRQVQLIREIRATEPVANSAWLLEKVADIKA